MGFQIKSPGLTCAASISNTFSTGRICLKLVEIFTSHTYRCFGIHRSSYWQVWSETIHFLTNWKFNDFGEQDRNICTGDKLHCQTRVKRCERIYFNPHHAWMWKLGVLSGLQRSLRRGYNNMPNLQEGPKNLSEASQSLYSFPEYNTS